VTFSCLLIGAISMLIAGAYYYSIYAQYGGIDFRRECIRVKVMPERKINFIYLETTCILESAWYEYLGTDSYDVKIIVSILSKYFPSLLFLRLIFSSTGQLRNRRRNLAKNDDL
jgi:hypothetical protein